MKDHKETITFKMISALETNYHNEGFNVNSLSERMHMDRVTLYRKTKRYFQKTPHNIIEEYRLEKAKGFLARTDILIKEVAYATGYSNAKHFSVKFKNNFGITPKQYRDQLLTLQN